MSLTTVFQSPGGQAKLLAANDRYFKLLSARYGRRFASYRDAWAAACDRKDPGDFPLSLDLAVNSGCQLSCVMCPLPGKPRRYQPMARQLLNSVMSQAAEAALPALTLGLASEPLLHPEIDSVIAAADRAGIMDVRLGTNGLALSPDRVRRLIDSGLTRLEISVDACDPRTYAEIRIGGDLITLERSINLFLDERSKRRQELPLLRLSFLTLPKNQGELGAFLDRWSDKADLISIQKPIWFPGTAMPKPSKARPDSEAPPDSQAPPACGKGWCVQPWQRLGLSHDGQLWPCCSWYGENLLSLDAKKILVAQAWRSPTMAKLRQAHLNGSLPGSCQECERYGAF